MKLTDSPEEIRKGYQHMMRRINQLIFYMFVWLAVCLVLFALFGHTESGAILLLVVGGIPELVLLLRLSLAGQMPTLRNLGLAANQMELRRYCLSRMRRELENRVQGDTSGREKMKLQSPCGIRKGPCGAFSRKGV